MTEMQSINALENPTLTNALSAAVLSDDSVEAPTIAPQPSGFVRLAGGLVRGLDASEVEYTAEVRELNGEDEEYIDRVRTGNPEKFFESVVERGTTKFGEAKSDTSTVGKLLLGDAELLFMEIARATYGDEITYHEWYCAGCDTVLDVTIEIDDIPIERLKNSEDRFFDVPLRNGRIAHCRLPIVSDTRGDLNKDGMTEAERKTILLSHTVLAISDKSGSPSPVAGSMDAARTIGSADRLTIITEIGNRKVGPKYNEVTFKHEECGEESPFPIQMGDLFPNY